MVGPPVSLDNTIGAAYLGVCFAAILFGITNLQTYIYFSRYPNDYLWQRVSVTALYLLDASHLSLTIAVVYHYLITEFGDLREQVKIVGTFKLQIAVNVGIIVVVQTLYAIRVWRLGRHFHRLLPYGIFVVVFAGCAVGVILAVKTYQTPTFPALSTISWTIYLSFSTSTFIDLVIAAAMCWYLQSSRVKVERFASSAQASGQMSAVSANMGGVPSPTSPTNANGGGANGEGRVGGGGRPRRGTGTSGSSNMTPTGRIIWRLMQYVVASGLATSACSMAALITYALLPNTLVFLGIEFLLTKLYINSFLAMLNARPSTVAANRQNELVGNNFASSNGNMNGNVGVDHQFREYASYNSLGSGHGHGHPNQLQHGNHLALNTNVNGNGTIASFGTTISPFRVHVRTSTRTHVSSVSPSPIGDDVRSNGGAGAGEGGGRDVWVGDDSKSSVDVDYEKDGIPMSPLNTHTLHKGDGHGIPSAF